MAGSIKYKDCCSGHPGLKGRRREEGGGRRRKRSSRKTLSQK
jgi:hypothetical protein